MERSVKILLIGQILGVIGMIGALVTYNIIFLYMFIPIGLLMSYYSIYYLIFREQFNNLKK